MGWNFRLIWTGKEEEKLSLFADNMILYTGSPKKLRTVRHWQKKLKTTQTDGKVYHVHGFEECIIYIIIGFIYIMKWWS